VLDNNSGHAKSISEIPLKFPRNHLARSLKTVPRLRDNAPGFYVDGRARAEWEAQSHFPYY
jgi:hypothetical protein